MSRFTLKKVFTTLIAGSIAIAGMTATPARAESEDVAKVIAGIAALAIIAKALDDDHRGNVHRTRPYPDRDHYDRKHHNATNRTLCASTGRTTHARSCHLSACAATRPTAAVLCFLGVTA